MLALDLSRIIPHFCHKQTHTRTHTHTGTGSIVFHTFLERPSVQVRKIEANGKSDESTVSCNGFQTTEFPPTLLKTFLASCVLGCGSCHVLRTCSMRHFHCCVLGSKRADCMSRSGFFPIFHQPTDPPSATSEPKMLQLAYKWSKPERERPAWWKTLVGKRISTQGLGLKNCLQMEMKRVCKGK